LHEHWLVYQKNQQQKVLVLSHQFH
jgi:hypothetical protein